MATHGVYQTAGHGARSSRQQDKPVWLPTAVQPHTKLHDSKEEVEDVATFNLQTARQTCVATNGSPATHQLHGSKEEVEDVATFILQTALSV